MWSSRHLVHTLRGRWFEPVTNRSHALPRTVPRPTISPRMSRFPAHQPPPATVVAALTRAGVSRDTAMAMERWKAQEVLDLLGPARKAADGAAAEEIAGPAC